MNPTVKITLTKTLILVFFALTAFFVLPGRVSAEEKIVGAFTVTGGQQNTDYTYADNTLTVNSGDVTIKNVNQVIPTADKIVVAGDASITLDGVNIDVNDTFGSCAFTVQNSAALNLTLAAGSTNSLTSGTYCAGLNVPEKAELTIDSDESSPGTLEANGSYDGAGIGGNSGAVSISGAITINGGVIRAQGKGGAGIGGSSTNDRNKVTESSSGAVTINGGSVTAISSYGAGIGGAHANSWSQKATSSCGDVTINGGTVTAIGGEYSAGIGGGHATTDDSNGTATSQGGNVVITGGSVKATKGVNARDNIGSGKAKEGSGSGGTETSGTLKNGSGADVSLVTLTLSGDSVKNKAINSLTVGGYTGEATADATNKKYGIHDVSTDEGGRLYLYLPADDPTAGSLAYATLKDDATNTLYAGSVTGEGGNRNATLALIDGAIDMNTAGGNLYIWNNGYGIGNSSSSAEKAKIPYSGNYTLSGGTADNAATNTVTVMPGYNGGTDGLDGYKTITLNGLNIDVSGNENSCAFTVNNGAALNLTLAAGSTNNLKSGGRCAGLNVPDGASLTIDSDSADPGSLTAQSAAASDAKSYGAGIGGREGEICGTITINGGSVTAFCYDGSDKSVFAEGAGIGGSYAKAGGTVTITGGTVAAYSGKNAMNADGAGIGGGYLASGGKVTITGGTVTACSNGGDRNC